jgi:hypothetical protein
MISAEKIANSLEKCRKTGPNKWMTCCPCHTDKNASFSVRQVNDRILVKCFAGCHKDDLIDRLSELGLWFKPSGSNKTLKNKDFLDAGKIRDYWLFWQLYKGNPDLIKDENHKKMAEIIGFLFENKAALTLLRTFGRSKFNENP